MKKKKIIVLIAVLTIILIILLIIVNKKKDNTANTENNDIEAQTSAVPTPSELEQLKKMNEKERITFYFSKYIKNLEKGDIDQSYSMLYDEFKNTYFDTIDKYKKYVKEKYPDIITVKYTNFQRQGVYYVMTLEFQDIMKNESFTQMFVLREYDYNDFVISFQAE